MPLDRPLRRKLLVRVRWRQRRRGAGCAVDGRNVAARASPDSVGNVASLPAVASYQRHPRRLGGALDAVGATGTLQPAFSRQLVGGALGTTQQVAAVVVSLLFHLAPTTDTEVLRPRFWLGGALFISRCSGDSLSWQYYMVDCNRDSRLLWSVGRVIVPCLHWSTSLPLAS